jgi:hypothetical protein
MGSGRPGLALTSAITLGEGTYRPHAVYVLTVDQSGVAHVAVFRDFAVSTLFAR